jgi:hypothetical protein
MTADTSTETEGDAPAAPTSTELATRIDGLESKLDLVISRLGGAKDQAHAAAEQHTEDRLDRPSTIAEEIRQQLDAQRAADADAAERRTSGERLAALEDRIKNMAEQTPQPPERKIEKILGWR